MTGLAAVTAAALLAASAVLPTTAPAAGPAPCRGREGVTVVVDHGAMGGGLSQRCQLRRGTPDAAALLVASGLELDYIQQQPGFICRVDGVPADDPCVVTPPQDAYWGLWWSDGETPTWRYATVAASGLSVPAGGAIGLAWQDTAGRVPPAVVPPVAGSAGTATSAGGDGTETADPGEPAGGGAGLPVWVGPAALLVVAGIAGGAILFRRRGAS